MDGLKGSTTKGDKLRERGEQSGGWAGRKLVEWMSGLPPTSWRWREGCVGACGCPDGGRPRYEYMKWLWFGVHGGLLGIIVNVMRYTCSTSMIWAPCCVPSLFEEERRFCC